MIILKKITAEESSNGGTEEQYMRQKTNSKMANVNSTLSTITFDVNRLNTPIKRQISRMDKNICCLQEAHQI